MRQMLKRTATAVAAAAWLVVVWGCGGSPSTGTTSPPDTTPAAIHIAGGDGQSGAAGATLPVHPSVLVVNAHGAGVAGVTVTFAIDSGGGSIAGGAAVTDSDGVATAGAWTLGAGPLTNVLRASVAGLTPIRFHATVLAASTETLFDAVTMGTGGGTLTYHKAGDPLDGLSLAVPAGSYSQSATWSVVADPTIQAPLPADVSQVGPALLIANGLGYSDSAMSLTVPMTVDSTDVVAPFYYDAASGALEGIPLADRTATSATLITMHFSASLTAAALGAAGGSVTGMANAAFGGVTIVWVRIPLAKLMGSWSSNFAVGTDNWEFINYGDYQQPGGDCYGMSVSELYYYYRFRTGPAPAPGLYHRYDKSLVNQWDNIQGIRLVGALQEDYEAAATKSAQARATAAKVAAQGPKLAQITSQSIALTIKVSRQPVQISLTSSEHGHSVVGYAATVSASGVSVAIADPNAPTTPKALNFDASGTLQNFSAATSASAASTPYPNAAMDGATAFVPLASFASRWQEFTAGNAGADRIPKSYAFQYFDPLQEQWLSLPDTVSITWSPFQPRIKCATCGGDTNPVISELWTPDGKGGAPNELPVGVTPYLIRGNAHPPWTDGEGFLDTADVVIRYTPFVLTPRDDSVSTADTVTFMASSHGLAQPGWTYTWEFRDSTAVLGPIADSIVKHPFGHNGDYTVRVTLRDATNRIVGRDSVPVHVKAAPHWVWNFSSAALTGSVPPPGGYVTQSDTLEMQTMNGWIADMHDHPENWVVFVIDSAGCKAAVLEQFPDGAVVAGFLVQQSIRTSLAVTSSCIPPGDPDTGTAAFGTYGSGKLTGNVSPFDAGDAIGVLGGSIDAQMAGDKLTGTFTWIIYFSTGYASYSFTFAADNVWSP